MRRGLDEAMQLVLDTDVAACDPSSLASVAAAVQRVRCYLDAVDASLVARSSELARAGGHRTSREAEVVVERAAVCTAMPDVHEALASGAMSAGHVDAIVRASKQLDDADQVELAARASELVDKASGSSVDIYARRVREYARHLSRDEGVSHHERLRAARSVRRWTTRDGMCHTQISLDPLDDARLSAMLDAAVAAEQAKPDTGRTWDQLRADALMSLLSSPTLIGGRRIVEILVLIDLQTLRDGWHTKSVCETYDGHPIPPELVRHLACEAEIIPIVLDGPSKVVDVGRARRLATADQRRALRTVHRTCAAEGCQVRFGDCDIHHIVEWRDGGPTNLANLLPLCSRHHHQHHEGRIQGQPPARAPAA